MSGWKLIGLYVYCFLLSLLAAVIAAGFATAPYWIGKIGHLALW